MKVREIQGSHMLRTSEYTMTINEELGENYTDAYAW